MATRSTIAYVDEESGKVYQIYCHWDGYPSYNGLILVEHYSSIDKIKDLIALGALSILGPTTGRKQNFSKPVDGMCLAYHRDRGGDLKINQFINLSDYNLSNHREDYNYIFMDGEWYFASGGRKKKILVKDALEKTCKG